MGLSIYYRYKIKVEADEARRLVERLHRFVTKLPFDEVTRIVEYCPPDGNHVFSRGPADSDWKPGWHYAERRRDDGLTEIVRVPSLHVICFGANLRGSETASFGLASHPPVVVHREDVVSNPPGCCEERKIGAGRAIEFVTRLRGWYSWSNCVKTQYAANPKFGGVENFLRAHLSVFRVLDECNRIGMKARIRDDGKYWKHHDKEKLIAELHRWDEIVAGIAGRICDRLGSEAGRVVAPIKDRPDFEHIEARGVRSIGAIRAKAKRHGKGNQ